MWRGMESLIQRLDTLRYRRGVERALALHLRGEVRNDGLKLRKVSTQLEIEWQARDVHPWDRDDPPDKKALRFVRPSLADTEAAINITTPDTAADSARARYPSLCRLPTACFSALFIWSTVQA